MLGKKGDLEVLGGNPSFIDCRRIDFLAERKAWPWP